MGTPEFSVPTLSHILSAGHDVVAAYTQPARRSGRGMTMHPSPVQAFAEASKIPVFTPATLRGEEEQDRFLSHKADAAVVVAYGLILPRRVLDAPKHGAFNVHASLLPRWRGAAPIQRAIMAGDSETAVAIMQMEEGLDTGPVCLAEHVAIGSDMTAGDLHDVLAQTGADLMVRALAALERGSLDATPQPADGVSYAEKITKGEARIDFSKSARTVHNQIRGLSPFPGAWFEATRDNKTERIKALRSTLADGSGAPGEVLDDVLTIACGSGAVQLIVVQRAGKKPAPVSEFLKGFALTAGTKLIAVDKVTTTQ